MGNKLAWTSLLIIFGVLSGVALSIKPWEKLREEQAMGKTAKAEMRQVEREHAELLRQQAQLDSTLGREELARKRGYKKPSEKPWQPQ